MTKAHQDYMRLALEEARKVTLDVPVGCVIVVNDEAIAQAHNQREELSDPTAHAEMLAIRQAAQRLKSWRLNGAAVFTTLEPCPMCAEALIQARVTKIVFGAYDQLSGACGSAFQLFTNKRIYPLPEVLGGILEEPCANLLKDYFKSNAHHR